MFICQEDTEVYTLMVEQRRILDGGFNVEFPAGGTTGESGGLKTIACRELQQELNLAVAADEL